MGRRAPKVQILSSPLQYYNNSAVYTAPMGSLIVFGGYPPAVVGRSNDVWISTDRGNNWLQLSTHPTNEMTFCSASLQNRAYGIPLYDSISPSTRYPIITTTNYSSWSSIPPSLAPPLIDRYSSVCMVDSQGYIYYLTGYNSTAPNSPLQQSQFYTDVWKSQDYGSTWTEQTTNFSFSGREKALAAVHRNNSYLGNKDILYILGGVNNRLLRDLWASSDGGSSWIAVNSQVSADFSQESSFVISDNGVLIMANDQELDVEPYTDTSNIWMSFDGGVNWNLCGSEVSYGGRDKPGVAVDLDGFVYIIGGYSYDDNSFKSDVWRSGISLHNLTDLSLACGSEVLEAKFGLTTWPSPPAFSSSSGGAGNSTTTGSSPSSSISSDTVVPSSSISSDTVVPFSSSATSVSAGSSGAISSQTSTVSSDATTSSAISTAADVSSAASGATSSLSSAEEIGSSSMIGSSSLYTSSSNDLSSSSSYNDIADTDDDGSNSTLQIVIIVVTIFIVFALIVLSIFVYRYYRARKASDIEKQPFIEMN